MDCENCKKKQTPESVTWYVYEETLARMDIANRRSWILTIISIALLIATCIWFYTYTSQFQRVTNTETQEVEQMAEGDGSNSFIGGDAYGGETTD